MLELENVEVCYGSIPALQGISLKVEAGSIVTLIGANGAGKSTTLRAISGLAAVRNGAIRYKGESIANLPPHQIVGRGLSHVPEGRMVFANLTVLENLKMGAYRLKDKTRWQGRLDYIFNVFPRLKERLKQAAGTLSGGEQQMLAIGRALMGAPRLLLLDEPSMGLAPLFVEEIFAIIAALKAEGTTILLVEQNASAALDVADHAYVLETGRIVLSGPAAEVASNPAIAAAYLGG